MNIATPANQQHITPHDPSVRGHSGERLVLDAGPRHATMSTAHPPPAVGSTTATGTTPYDAAAEQADEEVVASVLEEEGTRDVAARAPCGVFSAWVRWERGQVGI